MNILNTYPFTYNGNETAPNLRFPGLDGRPFSFTISVNSAVYSVAVTYNIWTNNGMVSIFDSNANPILVNIPLIEAFNPTQPNFLFINIFPGYFLIYDPNQGGFVFGAL